MYDILNYEMVVVLIDFSKYKENLSIDAFVSIVSKDFIKELDVMYMM